MTHMDKNNILGNGDAIDEHLTLDNASGTSATALSENAQAVTQPDPTPPLPLLTSVPHVNDVMAPSDAASMLQAQNELLPLDHITCVF